MEEKKEKQITANCKINIKLDEIYIRLYLGGLTYLIFMDIFLTKKILEELKIN